MTVGDLMDRIVEDAVNEAVAEAVSVAVAEKDAELIQKDDKLKFYEMLLKEHNINVDYH